MSQVEIKVWQTDEVANSHSDLKHQIMDLLKDALDRWSGVSYTVDVHSGDISAPSQEVNHSGSDYACFGDEIQWDNLCDWWQSYAPSCYADIAADSNLLITNGDADPDNGPTGKGFIGGQFAVVEHGPLVSSNWQYNGTYNSSSYGHRLAMNSVHEVGHNLDCVHKDGRLDVRTDGEIQETPMTNRYGSIAIQDDWNLNCDDDTPDNEDTYWTENKFSDCAKNSSYL